MELHRFRRQKTTNKLLIVLMVVCLAAFLGMFVRFVMNPAISAAVHPTLNASNNAGPRSPDFASRL